MSTPNQFTWVAPTTNTDGTAITPGEITGYTIGIRPLSGGAAGTYPIQAQVASPTATNELIVELGTVLKPDSYVAAIRTVGSVPSDWTAEVHFTISPPQPNPPNAFAAA